MTNVENAHGHPIAKERRLDINDFMGRCVLKKAKTAEAFAHECNKEELIKLIGEDEKLGRQLVQAAKHPHLYLPHVETPIEQHNPLDMRFAKDWTRFRELPPA